MKRRCDGVVGLLLAWGFALCASCGSAGLGGGVAAGPGGEGDGDSGDGVTGAEAGGDAADAADGASDDDGTDPDGSAGDSATADGGPADAAASDAPDTTDASADGKDSSVATCGDGVCAKGEQCPADCKAVCGDLVCSGAEGYAECKVDCGTFFKAYQSCGLQHCGGPWASCLSDAGCVGYYNCVLGCKTEACYADCSAAVAEASGALAEALDACMNDSCDIDYQPPCGDLLCEAGETAASCAKDCPPQCGDQSCDPPETAASCKADCDSCGDGKCGAGEDINSCPPDCDPCGDGICDAGETKASCPADCGDCGNGICDFGETKAGCPADCDTCGNGVCNSAESPATCPSDCAAVCGDGACTKGETLTTCTSDCKVCGDQVCSEGESAATCAKDCPPCPKCKAGEVCVPTLGLCVLPKCQLPTKWANVQKFASLSLTKPQDACDLNGDGVGDNAFHALESFASYETQFSAALASGAMVPMFEAIPFVTNGSGFLLRALEGKPAAAGCNLLSPTANCAYHVYAFGYDLLSGAVACPALRDAPGSKIVGGTLSASFTAYSVPIPFGPSGGALVMLPVQDVLIVGDVNGASTWQSTTGGKICGVVTPAGLNAMLNAIPADVLAGSGLNVETFKIIFKAMLKADVDTDGDTADDSWSVSFTFTTVQGTIQGLAY